MDVHATIGGGEYPWFPPTTTRRDTPEDIPAPAVGGEFVPRDFSRGQCPSLNEGLLDLESGRMLPTTSTGKGRRCLGNPVLDL
ncbi:hypothetical protein JTB14_026657 [Gonioctena quinquepunctata]|nr:hypothetical protein JTB14_026657 [Gonioctena quinquepunctata]